MMTQHRLKLTGKVLEFFKKAGSRGGKARARKHSPEQLSEWAKHGGRPLKKKNARPKEATAARPVVRQIVGIH